VRGERRPHCDVVLVPLLCLALKNRDVSEQELAQRPQQAVAHAIRIPLSDNPYNQPPLAQILGAALFPEAAL